MKKTYYVCEKYGCLWVGNISDMRDDYEYPENSTWYFDTLEEANDFADAYWPECI